MKPTTEKKAKKKKGRPPAYATIKDLQATIDNYFESCKDNKGKYVIPPTKYSFAKYLGVHSDTVNEYESGRAGPEFSAAIKDAKNMIEDAWTRKLWENYPTGAIFYLKNAYKKDWRDRYDHTSDGEKMPAPTIVIYGQNDHLAKVMERRGLLKK